MCSAAATEPVLRLALFSTEQYSICKTNRVLRSSLIFYLSNALFAVAWSQPSPTPNQIISHIPRHEVQSTAIAKIGYSKRRHILEIEFVNGAVYRYLAVPLTIYRAYAEAKIAAAASFCMRE